jgi:histidyl-tRNA synthetase
MINELELIQIVETVFDHLGIRTLLKINNRKILYGIAETIGYADKMIDITVAIDKLDKIGLDAVNAELQERGISAEAVEMLQPILSLEGTNREKLERIAQIISGSETGLKGVEEMSRVLDYVESVGVKLPIELDLSLARGLNYYTGAIFEVKALDFQIGSICGGGRYDDLTGIFGLPGMSGVGISFGADRIYDVMSGLDLFPMNAQTSTQLLFVNFGGLEELESLKVIRMMRECGFMCEIYPEAVKMKKQMDYANRRSIPYVAIIGESERVEGKIVVKRMADGEQKSYTVSELVDEFKLY